MSNLASSLTHTLPENTFSGSGRRCRKMHLPAWTYVFTSIFIMALMFMPAFRSAFAQVGTTATVAGTVTDPSGAVIVGAKITIRNKDTGIERDTVTLGSGNYVITELQPGRYSMTVERAGFKRSEQQNILLVIGQRATINASLQLGSSSEQVMVTASDVPVIQTEESSIGALIESKTIVNTPLNGRLSVMGLMALAPGVQNAGAQDQMPVYGVTPAIGGGSRNSYGGVGYSLDGASNMNDSLMRGTGEVPPLDGIAEFKLLTSAVPAQYSLPAQVIVVSKGGTNEYHGMLVEFNRVAATSAKEYFNHSSMPKYIRNEYGVNFSGPIRIPHLYNGHDRSFFYFNWENYELRQADTISSQEPTEKMRLGDFSEFGTSSQVNLYDVMTGRQYGNNISTDLNSVTVKLQNLYYPHPTTSGTGINTVENVPYHQNAKRVSLRADHALTSKDSLRFTYLYAKYGPNESTGYNSLQGGMSNIGETVSNFIVGWTHIFSPTLLADVTTSYFHEPVFRTPQNVNTDNSFINGLGTELINGAPSILISNITTVNEAGSRDLNQEAQLSATVSKILAHHTIKAGFTYLYNNHWNQSAQYPQRGGYGFDGEVSGSYMKYLYRLGYVSSYQYIGYADFLMGYPYATEKSSPNTFITRNREARYGAFVQDDWKLTPKLTINVGIRYDVQKFRPNPYNNNAVYIPELKKIVNFATSWNDSTAVVPAIASLMTSYSSYLALAGDVNMKPDLFSYIGQDTNNWAPRLGFAYSVSPKTVVRGAFGIYFSMLPGQYTAATNIAGNLPFSSTFVFIQGTNTGASPYFTMSNPFVATGSLLSVPSLNAQHTLVTPYTEQYNLAVEQNLGHGTAMRIGYVGQHNLKINNNGNGTGTFANYARDINFPATLTGTTIQSQRPQTQWGSIVEYGEPIFHQSMNSLQVGLHKQYTSGLMVNAEYTWTRILGTESFMSNYNTGDSYGNIGGIARQVFVTSYSYPLPLGHGKTFLANAGNLTNKIVSGWQFSGITNVHGGTPFSVDYTCSDSNYCVSGRADRVAGVALYPGKKTRSQWFNTAAFKAPDKTSMDTTANPTAGYGYQYGNSGYNMLWGPSYQNWDMNLQKTTKWREKIDLQLRMDAFNVFNHASLSNPASDISNTKTLGIISDTNSKSRKVEFGAKLNF
jgi:hypothetical protein